MLENWRFTATIKEAGLCILDSFTATKPKGNSIRNGRSKIQHVNDSNNRQ
jgi:hypothetical protein